MDDQYNVVLKGDLLDGFDLESVMVSFSKMFKIDLNTTKKLFSGDPHTIKKGVDHKTAYQFKTAMERIGVVAELRRIAPRADNALASLSLEPIEVEAKQPLRSESPVNFSCPKCLTKQNKGVQCVKCGVVFEKVIPRVARGKVNNTDEGMSKELQVDEDRFSRKAFLGAAGAAILGAFIWKIIAVTFDYELGLVAWGIGGAVGFSAAMLGAKGQQAGVICGLLALFAIFGGKYLIYDSYIAVLNETMSSISEELRPAFEAEQEIAANYYRSVEDEESKNQFIVDFGYSDYDAASSVTLEEVAFFDEEVLPKFESIENGSLDFEGWLNSFSKERIEDKSTLSYVFESLGLIDFLFLFLGVATAFRLGSSGRSSL